jgi:hypothetical protein
LIPAAIDQGIADEIIEKLRETIPPTRFVSAYSSGHEDFLKTVRRRHLESPSSRGRIRFISGSWGAGKTHFLRLLREEAFDARYLVSTVELNALETPFNKFEEVFYAIVRNITSPEMYEEGQLDLAAPFKEVLRRALFRGLDSDSETVPHDRFTEAKESLLTDDTIDIDFRRMVIHFWETYLPEAGDVATLEDRRERITQWFSGEGTVGSFRSEFGVQKIVSRANARLMLQALSRFITHIGYRGLVAMLDEAELSYSVMRKPNLKQAHNNLLHLINSVDESEGLFLLYAATPDFFIDDRYGVIIYGALAQRIGRPEDRPPRALDRVWNLDAMETSDEDYVSTAMKIREIYGRAYPEDEGTLPSAAELGEHIRGLVQAHPEFSRVSTWRVMIGGTISILDSALDGEEVPPPEQLHDDIMERLRG